MALEPRGPGRCESDLVEPDCRPGRTATGISRSCAVAVSTTAGILTDTQCTAPRHAGSPEHLRGSAPGWRITNSQGACGRREASSQTAAPC